MDTLTEDALWQDLGLCTSYVTRPIGTLTALVAVMSSMVMPKIH